MSSVLSRVDSLEMHIFSLRTFDMSTDIIGVCPGGDVCEGAYHVPYLGCYGFKSDS